MMVMLKKSDHMLLYDLDIKFGFGQIGINIYPGDFSLKKASDSGFDMKIKKPEIIISTRYPEINIDFSRCRSEMGYPSLPEAAIQWQDDGKQTVSDYIDKKVAEGNALADIHKGVSIQEIAYSDAFPEPPETNVDFIPKSRPKITVQPGQASVDFTPGDITVSVNPLPVKFNYDRARVNVFLEKKPYIDINAVYVGRKFDLKV
jgi:hypothetical protein